MAGKQQGDVITTSTGAAPRDDPDGLKAGDEVTTSGVQTGGSPVAEPYQGQVKGEGERDWRDVNDRIVQLSGVTITNFGDVSYTEEGDISDDDVATLEAQFEKAGAQPGQGRAVALAARQMGYGIKFTARKGS